MAGTKVTQLNEDANPTSDDLVLAVDNATGTSKKVSMGNLVEKGGAGALAGKASITYVDAQDAAILSTKGQANGIAPLGSDVKINPTYLPDNWPTVTTQFMGVNAAGAEFGSTFPGVYGTDYIYNGLASYNYLASRGHKLTRVPFRWERIQHTLGGALDTSELTRLQQTVAQANSAGLRVILDLHNYARYNQSGNDLILGSASLTQAHLVDLWTRLSTAFKGGYDVGYSIMNEPHDMPGTLGTFSGSTLFDWVSGVQNWTSSSTLANSSGRLSISKAVSGSWDNLQADTGGQALTLSSNRKTLRFKITADAAVTGNWKAFGRWQDTGFTWSDFDDCTTVMYRSDNSTVVTALPAGVECYVESTFVTAIPTDAISLGFQIEANSPPTQTATFYIDNFQHGTVTGALTGAEQWESISTAVYNAIVANGDANTVYVCLYGWAHGVSDHPDGWWIPGATPELHLYFDDDRSGIYANSYATETTNAINGGYASVTERALARLAEFTVWLGATRGFVGEIGWPNTSDWNAVGNAVYGVAYAADLDVTYWAASEWLDTGYPLVPYHTNGGASLSTTTEIAAVIEAYPSKSQDLRSYIDELTTTVTGETGEPGDPGTTPWVYRGTYDNDTEYAEGDAVTYSGGLYRFTSGSTGVAPDIGQAEALTSGDKATITIGKTGSGTDFECDGVDDNVQFQAAMDLAVAGTNAAPANIMVIGYNYAWQYSFSDAVVLKPVTGGNAVHIYMDNAVIKNANGYSGEKFISQNFYSEINSNYNSYSTLGGFYLHGGILEGNSGNGTIHTFTYANFAAFPATGVDGRIYVDRATDTGYMWNGSAYYYAGAGNTAYGSGIKNNGKHWRAYAHHQIKIYGFHYVIEDTEIYDSLEFALYSEQTNTDTEVFNDYATMETVLRHLSIVGYNLGGINWLGPHDSTWYDIGPHTNHWVVDTVLYNVYIAAGANFNGGGLVVHNFHPWANTASYGANVVLDHASIRGDAYIEGSTNGVGLRAISSTMSLDLVTTNTALGVELTDCYNVSLRVDNYYQFVTLEKLVKIIGTLTGSQIYIKNIDNNNLSGSPQVFDITEAGDVKYCLFWARIPHLSPEVAIGLDVGDLDETNELDIIKFGDPTWNTRTIRQLPMGGDYARMTNDGWENMKFQPQTLHGTPWNDWLEYDGSHLYMTNHTGTRHQLNALDYSGSSVDGGSA